MKEEEKKRLNTQINETTWDGKELRLISDPSDILHLEGIAPIYV